MTVVKAFGVSGASGAADLSVAGDSVGVSLGECDESKDGEEGFDLHFGSDWVKRVSGDLTVKRRHFRWSHLIGFVRMHNLPMGVD